MFYEFFPAEKIHRKREYSLNKSNLRKKPVQMPTMTISCVNGPTVSMTSNAEVRPQLDNYLKSYETCILKLV
jgi:hypothetical protein